MAFRRALLTAAIAGIVAAASAQTTTPGPAAGSSPAQADGPRETAASGGGEATKGHDRRPTADTDRTESTGDFNVAGDVSASALIGAKIHNESGDTIGTVEDLFVDDRGTLTTVVVSVGGFLGIGARSVGLKWSDVRRRHDGTSVVLISSLGKDALNALPPYTVELRKRVAREQAAAPR